MQPADRSEDRYHRAREHKTTGAKTVTPRPRHTNPTSRELCAPFHAYAGIRSPLHPRSLRSAPCDVLSEYASVARLTSESHRHSRCITICIERDTGVGPKRHWGYLLAFVRLRKSLEYDLVRVSPSIQDTAWELWGRSEATLGAACTRVWPSYGYATCGQERRPLPPGPGTTTPQERGPISPGLGNITPSGARTATPGLGNTNRAC